MSSDICPICGSVDYLVSGKARTNSISEKFVTKDYKVVQCKNCSAYFVSPPIDFSDEQWSRLYNSDYFTEQSDWLLHRREQELMQRFTTLEKFISGRRSIKFLDIGTGEGKTLIEGTRRNWDVTGIDIVDNRISQAKDEKIRFIKGKFVNQDFPENNFDIIYMDSVLEHVLNPLEYMKKVHKILKPGGIVFIGVPNEDALFNDIRKIAFTLTNKNVSEKIKPFDTPYHVIGFNEKSLNYLIRSLDFKLLQLENTGRKFDFLGSRIATRGFWIGLLFLLPVEFIRSITKRDMYYLLYLSKE
jgi:ubiquinone/menaquinone biosynthesis C-methylase UbiE